MPQKPLDSECECGRLVARQQPSWLLACAAGLPRSYYNAAQIRIKKEEEQRKAEAARRADEARKRIEEQSKIQGEILQQRIVERQRKEHEWKRRQDEARALREEKIRHEKEEKYALGLSDVRELFTQQENIIRDRFGNRWVELSRKVQSENTQNL